MSQFDLQEFVQKHTLGHQYDHLVMDYYAPLARELVNLHQNKQKTILVGINGAQGSGKSTLSDLLVEVFGHTYGLNAVALSLDDFYYQRVERQHLAKTVHPLFETRGVPGTHDITLANETLDNLLHHNNSESVFVPRFNKAIDDRFEKKEWTEVTNAPDIIIFEGWCVGATAQNPDELAAAVNELEASEDEHGIWRSHVNSELKQNYEPLFDRFDCTVMLQAPSFECVYNWRLEQEEKLIATLNEQDKARTMSPKAIERFIQHYQRITQHVIATLPNTAEYVYELNSKRDIKHFKKISGFNPYKQTPLIFTDLDGSLLDHYNYSFEAALSTLEYLEQNSIPVIPCSSKTQTEIEALKKDLKNHHPFIAENGAAVFIPVGYFPIQPDDTVSIDEYWVKQFVEPHEHWLSILQSVKEHFSGLFTSFSEMSIEEIASATGLSLEKASLAANRQYGEPVLWQGNSEQKNHFINAIKAAGGYVLQGGRFLHVCGQANKGKALIWLANVYQQILEKPYSSIAIGDSHNDIQMLDMADTALIIRSPVHDTPKLSRADHAYISEGYGPIGWAHGINQILDDLLDHKTPSVIGELHG